MESSPAPTLLGRCVISGAIAVFAFGFLVEGVRTLQRGTFRYSYSATGKRGPPSVRYSIGEPYARPIGCGCLSVGTAILLWAAVALVPALRATPRRRAVISLASGFLLGAGILVWLPPWRLWPHPPLLVAYLLPASLALLWALTRTKDSAVQEVRRTRAVLALIALIGLLWFLCGVWVIGGAALGVIFVLGGIGHWRFADADGRATFRPGSS